ncbi:hypothetical protein E2562_002088 [Oryza meyeriana var. granulata]|uniref:Peptidase A1 domain-containing protein n=1 Tax=Oryza meyeriana var. granulata TaxID=110450 RepID=A0A6G1EDH9_9ORYZ|nr:hypothetical protein E2562_002088 [Oryza meyeriana var. granulata]
MSLVFVGGAVMELKTKNFLYSDNRIGLDCLTILPSQDEDGFSLLGSLIQTGTHMIFDIHGSKLCSTRPTAAQGGMSGARHGRGARQELDETGGGSGD